MKYSLFSQSLQYTQREKAKLSEVLQYSLQRYRCRFTTQSQANRRPQCPNLLQIIFNLYKHDAAWEPRRIISHRFDQFDALDSSFLARRQLPGKTRLGTTRQYRIDFSKKTIAIFLFVTICFLGGRFCVDTSTLILQPHMYTCHRCGRASSCCYYRLRFILCIFIK